MPLNNAHGLAYEPYALSQYEKAHPDRVVFYGKGGIPDAILALATGKPVTPEMTRELKREHADSVDEALANGKEPKGLSEHFGMDGVSVDAGAWCQLTRSMTPEKLLSPPQKSLQKSLHILECKVGVADCHVLGPTIALAVWQTLPNYGPKEQTAARSRCSRRTSRHPRSSTEACGSAGRVPPRAHSRGAVGVFHRGGVCRAPRARSATPGPPKLIDCYTSGRRRLRGAQSREWKKGNRLCVVHVVVMGMGKTVRWVAGRCRGQTGGPFASSARMHDRHVDVTRRWYTSSASATRHRPPALWRAPRCCKLSKVR